MRISVQRHRPSDLAAQINAEHERCERSFKDGCNHAIACGRLLLEAKAQHKHGGWLAWIDEHCQFARRLAQRYMQIAKAQPKLDEANTTRVSHLSFREALRTVQRSTKALTCIPKEDLPQVIEALDSSGGDLKDALEEHRRASHRVKVATYKSVQDHLVANALEVAWPASWSSQHQDKLMAQARLEPEVADFEAQHSDLCRRRAALIAALEELNREFNERFGCWAVKHRVLAAVEHRHGPLVKAGSIRLYPKGATFSGLAMGSGGVAHAIADEAFENLRAAKQRGNQEDQLRAISYCVSCAVPLDKEHQSPADKEGFIHIVCKWCLEHRGETHCFDCGAPLQPDRGELMTCTECQAKEDAELPELSFQEKLAALRGTGHSDLADRFEASGEIDFEEVSLAIVRSIEKLCLVDKAPPREPSSAEAAA